MRMAIIVTTKKAAISQALVRGMLVRGMNAVESQRVSDWKTFYMGFRFPQTYFVYFSFTSL